MGNMNIFGLDISGDMLNSIVTFLVGLVAILVYWLTKKHEKRDAATVIVMDIRRAEQVVDSLLTRGVIDRSLKTILYENNWAKYKHLFVSHLSTDEFAALNRFFESCVEIAEAKQRMNDVFYTTVNAKAALLQEKILNIENPKTEKGKEERERLIKLFNEEEYVFDPQDPKTKININLNLLGRPSTGTAFGKLKKIAKLRD